MESTTSSSINPSVPSNSVARLFRAVAGAAAVVALGLVVYGVNATLDLYGFTPEWSVNLVNLAVPWLMLGGAAWAVRMRTPLRRSLPALSLLSSFLVYLAWDDPAPPPPTVLSPVISADSKCYETYSWLLKDGEGRQGQEDRVPNVDLPYFPQEKAEWTESVLKHRETWEAAWTEDTLGREWLAGMAAHEPEGYFPNEGMSTPLLDFARVRRASHCHWARAHLLFTEGQTDEAARILLTVVRAGYNLQRGGSTLVTQMIASVLTKNSYESLGLLLDSGTLSDQLKMEIAGVLRQAPSIRQNLALAFIGEEIYARSAIAKVRDPDSEGGASLVGNDSRFAPGWLLNRLLFNPNRTEREHVEFLAAASRLAQDRQMGRKENMDPFDRLVTERRIKNPVGRMLAAMSLPAFGKVSESFWDTDDLRLALLRQIEPAFSQRSQ